jgi:hypothetical protein
MTNLVGVVLLPYVNEQLLTASSQTVRSALTPQSFSTHCVGVSK